VNPKVDTYNTDFQTRERQIVLGGFHKTKLNSRALISNNDFDSMSIEFCMSMDFCMSMQQPVPAPTPTGPLPITPSPTGPLPTTPPVQDPTNPPTLVPSPVTAPTSPPDNCESKPREEAFADLLSNVTDPSVLSNPSTPQGAAFRWLVDSDPSQIDPCTYPTLTQRYALTTFYYSTNGDDWTDSTGWLTATNECTWFGISCGSDLVTEISIGTYRWICPMVNCQFSQSVCHIALFQK
jgi:hypothetical protein